MERDFGLCTFGANIQLVIFSMSNQQSVGKSAECLEHTAVSGAPRHLRGHGALCLWREFRGVATGQSGKLWRAQWLGRLSIHPAVGPRFWPVPQTSRPAARPRAAGQTVAATETGSAPRGVNDDVTRRRLPLKEK